MFDKQLLQIGVLNPRARTLRALIRKHPVSGKRMWRVYWAMWIRRNQDAC